MPVEVDAAVRDAVKRYRGDVPTRFDHIMLYREYGAGCPNADKLAERHPTADALRQYMTKATIYRPYLEAVEKALPGAARDRAIEDLRRMFEQTEKKP